MLFDAVQISKAGLLDIVLVRILFFTSTPPGRYLCFMWAIDVFLIPDTNETNIKEIKNIKVLTEHKTQNANIFSQ